MKLPIGTFGWKFFLGLKEEPSLSVQAVKLIFSELMLRHSENVRLGFFFEIKETNDEIFLQFKESTLSPLQRIATNARH